MTDEPTDHRAGADGLLNSLRDAEPQQIESEVLRRLIEEIRIEETEEISAYNRYHNRHNRSR